MRSTTVIPPAPAAASQARVRVQAHARAARAHAWNLGQLLGSHLGVALAGLASLPLLARNLGPAAYGQFSLFVTTLGVLSNLDLARPILVRELARGQERARRGAHELALTSACALAALAAGIGLLVQGPATACALGLAVLLHGVSSSAYAELASRGRVGLAGSVRNGWWAAALVATVALSFRTRSPHAYVWAFVGANLGIVVTYQCLVRGALGPFFVRPRAAALRAHQRQALDVAAFAGASAVVASADKVLLEGHAGADQFGHYAAQYDLATKVNIVSTALGSVLLPAFARLHEQRGPEEAARRFVRIASWIALAYFIGLAMLIAFNGRVTRLVLGSSFVAAQDVDVYALMLVGVFVHLFGFLLTAYQRACGDFRTHRIAYIAAGVLMLGVGVTTIPRYGALGAVATYLCGRTAELALIAVEVRRMPRAALPRWRVVALGGMVLTLALGAAWVLAAAEVPA